MLPMGCEGELVQDAHEQGRDDERQVDDHEPQEFVVGDVLQVHEGAQQVDGGDGDDRGSDLELEGARVQLAESAQAFEVLLDIDAGDEE
jgi:hypothetical protein